MHRSNLVALVILVSLLLFCCHVLTKDFAINPPKVVMNSANLYPYGLAYSSKIGFLVGSLTQGLVYKVSDSGSLTPFVSHPSMQSVTGIQTDDLHNLLYIVNTNVSIALNPDGVTYSPVYSKVATLIKANLQTGAIITIIDFSNIVRPGYTGNFYPTDVCFDTIGSVYITDSLQGVVIQIDINNNARLFASDSRWFDIESDAYYGVTGIDFFNNNIIVGKNGMGRLFKIPIQNPSQITEVLVKGSLKGLDGLNFLASGSLIVSAGSFVSQVVSVDNFDTATVISVDESIEDGSTLANRGVDNYVLTAHLDDFFAGRSRVSFEIKLVNLPKIETDIIINSLNLYPYGLEWTPSTGFLVSSVTQGKIYQVNEATGEVSAFCSDNRLVSVIGMQADYSRGLLYVTNTDAPYGSSIGGTLAAFVSISLRTGEVVSYVDLSNLKRTGYSGNLFVHDVAADNQGNMYIIESLSGTIYKIDATTKQASIFATDSRWHVREPSQFSSLDGIEFINDATGGYLIIAKSGSGRLFKIPVNSPAVITEVTLAQNTSLIGIESIKLRSSGTLCIVGDFFALELASNDNFVTAYAKSIAQPIDHATTCATRGDFSYALSGHLSNMIENRNRYSFEIHQLQFAYPPPLNISFTSKNLFPYGIDYIPKGFIIGSLTKSMLYLVSDKGDLATFISDPNLKQVIGVQADPLWNNIYIATSEVTTNEDTSVKFGVNGGILIADITTGATKLYVDMSNAPTRPGYDNNNPCFYSDVTADNQGNIYVLESVSGAVYKVSQTGNIQLFAYSQDWYNVEDNTVQYTLSGIDYKMDLSGEYLIVGKISSSNSRLFKVSIPSGSITEVKLSKDTPIVALEGLNFNSDGYLYATGRGGVYKITSSNSYATAKIVAYIAETDISTICERDGKSYYIGSHIRDFYSHVERENFYITQAVFPEATTNVFVQFFKDNSTAVITGFVIAIPSLITIAILFSALIILLVFYMKQRNSAKAQARQQSISLEDAKIDY